MFIETFMGYIDDLLLPPSKGFMLIHIKGQRTSYKMYVLYYILVENVEKESCINYAVW